MVEGEEARRKNGRIWGGGRGGGRGGPETAPGRMRAMTRGTVVAVSLAALIATHMISQFQRSAIVC